MSEEDKKKFCKDMMNRKAFFEDAYRMMMGYFESTLKENADSVAGNAAEK